MKESQTELADMPTDWVDDTCTLVGLVEFAVNMDRPFEERSYTLCVTFNKAVLKATIEDNITGETKEMEWSSR